MFPMKRENEEVNNIYSIIPNTMWYDVKHDMSSMSIAVRPLGPNLRNT